MSTTHTWLGSWKRPSPATVWRWTLPLLPLMSSCCLLDSQVQPTPSVVVVTEAAMTRNPDGSIETALRSDPTLVHIGVDASYFSVQVRQPVHIEEATDEGHMCEVISAVRCLARI